MSPKRESRNNPNSRRIRWTLPRRFREPTSSITISRKSRSCRWKSTAKYQLELTALQGLGQKLIDDKSRNDEAKKPLAADIKLAKEKINSELSADVVEIKNLKIARKKLVTDQVDAIKVKMSQVEKIGSDKGEVSQAIAEYQAAKSTLLKSLSVDMTEPNFQTADAAVKRLAAATDKVLAVDKTKRDRIAASLQTMNTLGPNLQPDEAGSFPQGSTRVIDKATDRTVVGHGPLFKPVLKALAEVEKSPVEPGLTTLEDAAKTYLADYDRRVKEGQDSGKAFKPDKITTAKADACRDAIEKVRKLRVTRDIQKELANLPQNPRTPDEEKAVNRLKAKMLVESGGSKILGADQSGASESFFLKDPTTNKEAFIFKPSDGEFDAGYGWEKGAAPREVVLRRRERRTEEYARDRLRRLLDDARFGRQPRRGHRPQRQQLEANRRLSRISSNPTVGFPTSSTKTRWANTTRISSIRFHRRKSRKSPCSISRRSRWTGKRAICSSSPIKAAKTD